MATKLEPPNANELAWIADNVARGRAMAEKYGGLDAVWTAFGASLRASQDDPNFLINMIGLALGQRFVDELGLVWIVATDEHGTEIAVHGQPGDVLIYPTNLVAKRWTSGEDGFIEPLFAAMRADLIALGFTSRPAMPSP